MHFCLTMLASAIALLPCTSIAQMQKQKQCAAVVKANIDKTRTTSPSVYSTIKSYAFEFSKSHDSCVMIIQYNVKSKGSQMVQVLALNAVTMQSMEGHKNVYLIPVDDEKQIQDAADFLFEKYSH
jgi:hypothetical protein